MSASEIWYEKNPHYVRRGAGQRIQHKEFSLKSLYISSLLVMSSTVACDSTTTKEDASAQRSFRFEYRTTISGFPAAAKRARVWLPLPTSDEAQSVTLVEVEAPVSHRLGTEEIYGNRVVYLEITAPLPKELPITLTMDVRRKEIDSVAQLSGSPCHDRLLAPDRLAPLNDEVRSRAAWATLGQSGIQAAARGIYNQVLADVSYDQTRKGWGRGDLGYVCAYGRGNCSDFHTLFVAMARSKEIPAVVEIGFPLPADKTEGTIGGYHCWAWYQDGNGRWRPVDASEADKDSTKAEYFFGTICENRIAFSRGRDLILDPPQNGAPVNFFIYPHVEVDGKTDVARVENNFRFENL